MWKLHGRKIVALALIAAAVVIIEALFYPRLMESPFSEADERKEALRASERAELKEQLARLKIEYEADARRESSAADRVRLIRRFEDVKARARIDAFLGDADARQLLIDASIVSAATEAAVRKKAVEAFRNTKILYSKIDYLDYGKDNLLNLSVASSDMASALERVKGGAGAIETGEARLSSIVEAALDGPPGDVEIELVSKPGVTSAIRDISGTNGNWSWHVRPKTFSDITLTYTITNFIDTKDGPQPVDGPAFTKKFVVHSTIWQRWKPDLKSFWAQLILVIGAIGTTVTAVVEFAKWRKSKDVVAQAVPKKRTTKKGSPPA